MKLLGKIHHSGSLFLREHVGTAKTKDGNEYEMSLIIASYTPLIRNTKTGKWFSLSWEDILDLAANSGIDEPEKCKTKGKKPCPHHQKR